MINVLRNKVSCLVALLIACPTILRAADGTAIWTNYYTGLIKSNNYAVSAVIDSKGDICALSSSYSSTNGLDFATIKYSKAGLPLWTNIFNADIGVSDQPKGIALDAGDNIYVTGSSFVGVYGCYATIKYSSTGIPLWTNRLFDISGNFYIAPTSIAVDGSSNVFVAGTIRGIKDFKLVKYSSNGTKLWENQFDGPAQSDDTPQSIAVDSSGDVIVTGYTSKGNDTYHIATLKCSTAGAWMWTNYFSATTTYSDYPIALAVGAQNNAYVAANSSTVSGTYRIALLKYSSAGMPLWTNFFSSPEQVISTVKAVKTDKLGNVFIAGATVRAGTYSDMVIIKYSDEGTPVWTNYYTADGYYSDEARTIAIDQSDNLYVAGVASGPVFSGLITFKFSNDGVPLWTNRFERKNSGFPLSIAVDQHENAYVFGHSLGSNSLMDCTLLKYSGPPPQINFAVQYPPSKMVLTWSNSDYTLQAASYPQGPYTNIASTSSAYTNPPSGNKFFRLIGN